ncbi:MAG: Zn-dependent exopeptidase M28 [Lachnospiraceae bacterium]|nr:Zn-dependent exopeptidase M28 [Lachnospiraceae bacterium]
MNKKQVRQILKDTDFIHISGSPEEKKVAEYLKARCEEMGVKAKLESFEVAVADVKAASLTVKLANGQEKEIPCKGFRLCGSGEVEAPLVYLPELDQASLTKGKDSIVLLDVGVGYWTYQDLLKNGAKGIITYDGNVHYKDRDIDLKELRPHVVGEGGKKILAVNINAKDAFALVKGGARSAKIKVQQKEGKGKSHNVVAEIPGTTDEWIVLSAHLDTTPLSRGSYDNMTGCIGLLMVMDALKNKPHRYGLRFVFCGSEERGLLGSKAYVAAHEKELEKMALNINLDMIGTYMGHFLARVSADEGLVTFIKYFAAAQGFGINASQGVYSSDSTPFADKGVPALSFARIAGPSQATIHNRYDTPELLSDEQMLKDGAFITEFTRFMADAVKCPVKREIPEKVKKQLDEYLARKRKEE